MQKTKNIILIFLLTSNLFCQTQQTGDYKPLDPNNPVEWFGGFIAFNGDTITLGPKAFFIDGQLTKEQVENFPYVFNSVNDAAKLLADGTEDSPMTLYIAPYVYWIDDPDDPEIRIAENGGTPYGLVIKCEWLKFYGLSENPENVVLACNRGQTIGAKGNFTMFRFIGQGTSSENITFGNYCNVDLVYPLKPELGRAKRASAIVQAQLIHCNGDKIVARNTRFISRLNLCPFIGGKRVLFDWCHFESTDDALCGTAVYLNSTLDFYSSKPFYWTRGTGAVFLNCDINVLTRSRQYFTKAGGQVAVVDTRFKSEFAGYFGWQDNPQQSTRNYQYNLTLNGKSLFIGKEDSALTVDLSGKSLHDAYEFDYNGETVYNTYNLLRGNDDWDPMGIKNDVISAEKKTGKNYSAIPVQMLIHASTDSIETSKNSSVLKAKVYRFGNYTAKSEKIIWTVTPEDKELVKLIPDSSGSKCEVIPVSEIDEPKNVIIMASTPAGLEAAAVINVSPEKLAPPEFVNKPSIVTQENGKLTVLYKIDTDYPDQSLVNWYRCTDKNGSNPVEVAVSRNNTPLLNYELSEGNIGYFIRVSVAPKHIRCDAGEPETSITGEPVAKSDVRKDPKILYTDFKNQSVKNQPEIIPGFWTFTHMKPIDDNPRMQVDTTGNAWYYGTGRDGAAGITGLLQGRSGEMLYTPVGNSYGNMKLSLTIAPFKSAGQGFSIADLFMDVLIKFDTKNMSGYALRFIRTTKYMDAVDCYFVKYEKGKVSRISEPVTTSCYRTPCEINIEVSGNILSAEAKTSAEYYVVPNRSNVLKEINIDTQIDSGAFGGFGIMYYGGASAVIEYIKAEWK